MNVRRALLVLSLAATLVGCGSGTGLQSPAQTSTATTPAPPTVAVASPTPGLGGDPPTAQEAVNAPKALPPEELDQIDDDVEKSAASIPSRVTLTGLPPVRNQGATNSCGAFSFGYALGSFLVSKARATSIADEQNQISASFMYRVALEANKATGCGYTRAANYFPYLIKNGSASWAAVGYPEADENGRLECSLFTDIDATPKPEYRALQLGSWQTLTAGSNVEEIKGFLREGKPVVALYTVYSDLGQTKTGVYTASGTKGGSHFMTVVGYDDDIAYTDYDGSAQKGALRVMNSWGTGYHDKGFVWIGYTTHATTCYWAYTAEAAKIVTVKPSGGELQAASKRPTGQIVQAVQAASSGRVDLVLQYQFADWVNLNSVTVTTPSGARMTQTLHDLDTRTGYLYFRRADGRQFEPGTYEISIDLDAADGSNAVLTARCTVAALASPQAAPPAVVLGTDGQPAQVDP